MPTAKHVQDIEREWWKGEEKYIRMTQDACFLKNFENLFTGCKVIDAHLFKNQLTPQTIKKIALPGPGLPHNIL